MQLHTPLRIFKKKGQKSLPTAALYFITEHIYRSEKIPTLQIVNLICCSDYTIRKLNFKYRNIDKTTDVLSFSFNEVDLLGEVYISLKRAEIQSRRFGLSFTNEMTRLYIHGLLHLIGYDHIEKNERLVMEKKERFILRQIEKKSCSII